MVDDTLELSQYAGYFRTPHQTFERKCKSSSSNDRENQSTHELDNVATCLRKCIGFYFSCVPLGNRNLVISSNKCWNDQHPTTDNNGSKK